MFQPKKYTIDLDAPPHKRWEEVLWDYKPKCAEAMQKMDQIITNSWMGKMAVIAAEYMIKYFISIDSVMYLEELKCMAEFFEIPVERIVLYQLIYELSAACTSIGFKCDGEMIHFRTMDWDFDFLRPLTVHLEFRKSGGRIFEAVSWCGYIGILTAMVPGAYSLSINFRKANGNLINNVIRLLNMKWPIGHLCRYILEEEMTFLQAANILQTYPLVSPCYIMLVDATSVAIITRDCDKLACPLNCSDTCNIQTNHDVRENTGLQQDILYSYARYRLASRIIQRDVIEERSTCYQDVVKQLLIHPIVNPETIYYCVMIPSRDEIHVTGLQ